MEIIRDSFVKAQGNKAGEVLQLPFLLPEKMIQFGSGFLFRGLWDLDHNKSGNQGIMNGRVVMVKSTQHAGSLTLNNREGMISRVLSVKEQWPEIMDCANNSELEVIIFNKKITGKNLLKDNIKSTPPFSFPGKLLAFLFQRFKYFRGIPEKGLLIVCSVGQNVNNAERLEAIILELAHLNNLEPAFLDWIENANQFCNKSWLRDKVGFKPA